MGLRWLSLVILPVCMLATCDYFPRQFTIGSMISSSRGDLSEAQSLQMLCPVSLSSEHRLLMPV